MQPLKRMIQSLPIRSNYDSDLDTNPPPLVNRKVALKLLATRDVRSRADAHEPGALRSSCSHPQFGQIALAEACVVGRLFGCQVNLLHIHAPSGIYGYECPEITVRVMGRIGGNIRLCALHVSASYGRC